MTDATPADLGQLIVGHHHTGLSVPDLEEGVRFYSDLLGFPVIIRKSWEASDTMDAVVGLTGSAAEGVILDTGNGFFELWEYTQPAPRSQERDGPASDHGINHVCFEVSDLEAAFARLTEAGVRFHCEPQDLGHAKTTYGRDPFGNIVEFIETVDPGFPSLGAEWTGDRYPDAVHT